VFLIAGHVVHNAAWVAEDTAPARWDQAGHLHRSLIFYFYYSARKYDMVWKAFADLDKKHAPFVPFFSGLICAVFGESRTTAIWINHLGIVVLCLALYGIGRRLAGPWCGLAAAYVTMAMPAVFGVSRQFLLEFSVTAAVAVFVYCLVRHEERKRVGITLLAALAVMIGLLIRETFLLYVAGPTLVALVYAAKRTIFGKGGVRKQGTRDIVTIVVAFALGGGVAFLLWYGPNFQEWYAYAISNVAGELGSHFSAPTGEYLWAQVYSSLIYYHAGVLALLAVVWWLFGRRAATAPAKQESGRAHLAADIIMLLAGVGVTLTVCLISSDRVKHFFFPVLPMLGVLLAYLYFQFTRGWIKYAVAGALLCLVVPVWQASWHSRPKEQERAATLGEMIIGLANTPPYAAPEKEDWKTRDVISIINRDFSMRGMPRKQFVNGVCIPSLAHFHGSWFKYIGLQMYVRGEVENLCQIDSLHTPLEASGDVVCAIIANQQYVVTKSGLQGAPWLIEYNERLMKAIRGAEYLFEEVPSDINLPDGSTVTIYRNRYIKADPGGEEVKQAKERFRKDFMNIR